MAADSSSTIIGSILSELQLFINALSGCDKASGLIPEAFIFSYSSIFFSYSSSSFCWTSASFCWTSAFLIRCSFGILIILFTTSIAPGTLNVRTLPPPRKMSNPKNKCQLFLSKLSTSVRLKTISPGEFNVICVERHSSGAICAKISVVP